MIVKKKEKNMSRVKFGVIAAILLVVGISSSAQEKKQGLGRPNGYADFNEW